MIDFLKYYGESNPLDFTLKQVDKMRIDAVKQLRERLDDSCRNVKHAVDDVFKDVLSQTGFSVSKVNYVMSSPEEFLTYKIEELYPYNYMRFQSMYDNFRSHAYCRMHVCFSIDCNVIDVNTMMTNDGISVVIEPRDIDISEYDGKVQIISALCQPDVGDIFKDIFREHVVPYCEGITSLFKVLDLCFKYSEFLHYKKDDAVAASNVYLFWKLLKTEYSDGNETLIILPADREYKFPVFRVWTKDGEFFMYPGLSFENNKMTALHTAELRRNMFLSVLHCTVESYKKFHKVDECTCVYIRDLIKIDGLPVYSDNPLRDKFYHDEIERLTKKSQYERSPVLQGSTIKKI